LVSLYSYGDIALQTAKNSLICPLCQTENKCDVSSQTGCWCVRETVPKELIVQVPDELKNKSCICQKCIRQFKQQSTHK